MALRDQPYIPLYVQDFLTDEKLIECSASATGIYIRLMCIMHKSEEYGSVLLKQKDKQSPKQILNFACKLAKQMPYPIEEIEAGLSELINEGVIVLEGDDKISQSRMVHDNSISLVRSKAGKIGGDKTHFAQAKSQANLQTKSEQNTEDENEYENKGECEGKIGKRSFPPTDIFLTFFDAYKKITGNPNEEEAAKREFAVLTQEEKSKAMLKIQDYFDDCVRSKRQVKLARYYLKDKSFNNDFTIRHEYGEPRSQYDITREHIIKQMAKLGLDEFGNPLERTDDNSGNEQGRG